ncbi:MAG TPA: tripartite tricarboxylate transporter substrate-binding protein [Ramlibacter sp.]|nr:tripartite tricarboxylate transporter substrate-binding protein [Ramlibacter sp.]
MTTRRSTLGFLAAAAVAPAALSQGIRQLTLVVPFPAAGATDAVARLVADGLRGRYADTVVVENRVGGNGRIGAVHVKNGPADGSLMLFTPAFPLAIFPHIYRTLPYDALQDFVPVATTGKGAFALSAGPAVPGTVRTLADFIAWSKANANNATYGAPQGGGQHFAGVQFARLAGAPLRMIPYKGGAPSVVDVLGGHIAAVVTPLPEVIQHVKDGKLRMLATTTAQRTRFTPDVPTMRELGYDVVFQDWSGLVAPARTPREVVARANAAVAEVIRSPAGAAAMERIGAEADLNTPEEFTALYRQTWERYRDVVKTTGFTAED